MKKVTIVLLTLIGLLAACTPIPITTSKQGSPHYRSETNHLEVDLPPGWAASEGPEFLAKPFEGLLAFNSWGQENFWVRQVETKTADGVAYTYSLETVLGQIPSDGAYIVLIDFAGGPRPATEDYGPEHKSQDLNDLWTEKDCRAEGPVSMNFYKWGRLLSLQVYCGTKASDDVYVEVNQLLESWCFDRVPAGDFGWASVTARDLLPLAVDPRAFPILSEGHTASSVQKGDILRMTRAGVIEGDVVTVTFLYRWDAPGTGPMADNCPPESCHWWRFEARPDGEVVLVEEGGAGLPDVIEPDQHTSEPSLTETPGFPISVTTDDPSQVESINVIRTLFGLPESTVEFVEMTRMLNSPNMDLAVALYQDTEGRKYSVEPNSNQVVEFEARDALVFIPSDVPVLSQDDLRAKAEALVRLVIPNFESLKATLSYEEGIKGDYYFFNWRGTEPKAYKNRPFVQIGLQKTGELFAYYNTLGLMELP